MVVRWFFMLLLLTNLALAGWLYSHNETARPEAVTSSPVSGQKSLQLLSELPTGSLRQIPHVEPAQESPPSALTDASTVAPPVASSVNSSPVESVPPAQQMTCVRIAQLASQSDVDVLVQKLAAVNVTVLDSGEEFSEHQTYWVMIPPYQSESAARDAAARLAKAKIRDFQLIQTGEFKDGISLGLFSQKAGADNRLQEIVALKLGVHPPEIRPRTSSVRSHWLIARVTGNGSNQLLQQQFALLGVQGTVTECPPSP